jgi:hypothetical protein
MRSATGAQNPAHERHPGKNTTRGGVTASSRHCRNHESSVTRAAAAAYRRTAPSAESGPRAAAVCKWLPRRRCGSLVSKLLSSDYEGGSWARRATARRRSAPRFRRCSRSPAEPGRRRSPRRPRRAPSRSLTSVRATPSRWCARHRPRLLPRPHDPRRPCPRRRTPPLVRRVEFFAKVGQFPKCRTTGISARRARRLYSCPAFCVQRGALTLARHRPSGAGSTQRRRLARKTIAPARPPRPKSISSRRLLTGLTRRSASAWAISPAAAKRAINADPFPLLLVWPIQLDGQDPTC